MFSLFPADGLFQMRHISDKWSEFCIFFLTSEFFTLAVSFPTLLLILWHWMSIVVQNSFYPSIYFSLYHPLGMIFYWMRKKSYNNKKYRSTSAIFHNTTWWIYIPRDPVLTKNLFFIVQDLYECTPPMQFFLWFYYPMILIFDI